MAQLKREFELFERYVNSKDNQTICCGAIRFTWFERYVNSKDNQTFTFSQFYYICLRDM